jgi:catechol 2,3-dioxygenase-like lactoylglutathione lyase family enzyme
MSEAVVARFDHIVVAVKDLRKALATYREALGFTAVPSGEDVVGTTAAWVHIGDYAVELIAVREGRPQVRWLQDWLDIAKENPPSFVVSVPDLDAVVARLVERGVPFRSAEPCERLLADGTTLRWREVVVAPESTPRATSPAAIAASGRAPSASPKGQSSNRPVLPPMPVLVQWEGGDKARLDAAQRLGAYEPHVAGWRDLTSVSVLVADPEYAAQWYETAFGWPRVVDSLAGRGVTLRLGTIRLELIAPPSGGRVLPPGPHPTAISLRAENRESTLEYLRERGTADGAGRGVTPAKAHGLRIALP